ncbi:MAG: phosphatase PAP2 family protein [Okeania sp. SIO1H5]|uniref:phosphatase PAP2 family protein n=1 Tax=Okeania sp. SIO1H5 TaxID=2607777 RepID=UPI0013B9E425|nr:phosphatase PAP2 family protein [Okeania sp. SIO1H5]NET23749.1 phosphatase PAP2 family protein [Okeania sp. SIO1H5]
MNEGVAILGDAPALAASSQNGRSLPSAFSPPPDLFSRIDLRFYHWLRSFQISKRTRQALKLMVRLGDGWIWALAIGFVIFSPRFQSPLSVIAHCLLTGCVGMLLYWGIKYSTRRTRPYDSYREIEAEVPPLDQFSFPSGHTMNNMAVALTLSSYLPSLLPLAIGVPFAWGVLRVYFGVHYLSDILAGVPFAMLAFFATRAFFEPAWFGLS